MTKKVKTIEFDEFRPYNGYGFQSCTRNRWCSGPQAVLLGAHLAGIATFVGSCSARRHPSAWRNDEL